MAKQTVYCEECVEEIPASEVYWDDGRLYCGRCGSEVQTPDRDIFEEIMANRSGFLFRDHELAEVEEEDDEDDKEAEQDDEEEDDSLDEDESSRKEADAD